ERGTSRSPLHSPPKGRPFMGPPHIGRVQRFPHRHQAWNWPRHALEIPPQQNEGRDALWGSPEGGIPPLGFLFHRFLCKESGAPAEQAARPARTEAPTALSCADKKAPVEFH